MITGIDHVVLTVRDIEASVAFYTRVLGVEAVSFAGTRRALIVGDQKINLQSLGQEQRNHAGIGSGDLCLLTERQIPEVIAHLQAEGVEILEGPVEKSGARGPITSVYFCDPDGNLIEVSRYGSGGGRLRREYFWNNERGGAMASVLRCISPVDGSVYAEREALGVEAARCVAERARAAQAAWAARPVAERARLVMAGVAAVGAMNDEIVPELAHMMGRPVRYGGEFGGFEERASHMAEIAEGALADIAVGEDAQFLRYIRRVPWGVVFVVAPWNYPYMTAINTVAPALIAGNTVVLKHATQTLLVGERMARAFHEAGVPEDVFQNVFLDHETTSGLIAARAFDFVNFTGSVAGGQAMERAAAGTFVPVGTELGGKDPGYVMEDADLEAAVDTLMDGAMFNAGQCCCGIERIYVHESLFDSFVEKAVAWVQAQVLGDPFAPETTMGPMANTRFAAHVRAQIDAAIAAGATAHIAPMEADDGGAYLTPQVLTGVTHDMDVMREESFGPVVGIMPVSGDDEAVALMNDSQYGLTASLWTSDLDRARAVGDRIETGTVFLNRADYLDPGLCWTGCKDTGRGGGLSVIGYHNLTRPKSYHLKKVTS